MSDEARELTPPKGYRKKQLFDGRSQLIQEESQNFIMLTNRPLSEVNSYFGNLLTTGVEAKIKEAHGRKVEILDLGSGTQSLACKEIGKEFGETVRISGIDFNPKDSQGVNVVQGDIRELPFTKMLLISFFQLRLLTT